MSIQFKLREKPDHPIVKAIRKYEDSFKEEDLIVYYPPTSESCGWTIEGHFLGYTISEVIETFKNK